MQGFGDLVAVWQGGNGLLSDNLSLSWPKKWHTTLRDSNAAWESLALDTAAMRTADCLKWLRTKATGVRYTL
ncbi:hypothetical protein WJX72_009835 [[Myrmecia] bisecta]|uniref:Uncharacterized protein n=1 Tax=[Myrmecia] bisecta TaxID=41462 RepID=A0AAW1PHZ2_9CHLO